MWTGPKKVVVEKIQNRHGSCAGASSSEFNMYRNERNRERVRVQEMEEKYIKEKEMKDFEDKVTKNKQEAEERTRKNAERRKKKKDKSKQKAAIS